RPGAGLRLRAGVVAHLVRTTPVLVVHVHRHAELYPPEDRRGVRDRHAQAAVAGRVVRHFGVAVDRVAGDEVVGVEHALGVEPRRLFIHPEASYDGRRRGLARAHLEDRAYVPAGFDLREHLPGEVRLDVATIAAVANAAAARALLQQLKEDRKSVV